MQIQRRRGPDRNSVRFKIETTVTFNRAVAVTGTPRLEIQFGANARHALHSQTTYVRSLTPTKLEFSYTVVEGDEDTDGIAIGASKRDLNGGTIQAGTMAAVLTHAAVSGGSSHKVDGVRPTFESAKTSTDGAKVIVRFSEDIGSVDEGKYTLTVDGVGRSASNGDFTASVAGMDVELALAAAMDYGDSITISVEEGAAADSAGNDNPAVASESVPTPPSAPQNLAAEAGM